MRIANIVTLRPHTGYVSSNSNPDRGQRGVVHPRTHVRSARTNSPANCRYWASELSPVIQSPTRRHCHRWGPQRRAAGRVMKPPRAIIMKHAVRPSRKRCAHGKIWRSADSQPSSMAPTGAAVECAQDLWFGTEPANCQLSLLFQTYALRGACATCAYAYIYLCAHIVYVMKISV
jgi:hypothetical protein